MRLVAKTVSQQVGIAFHDSSHLPQPLAPQLPGFWVHNAGRQVMGSTGERRRVLAKHPRGDIAVFDGRIDKNIVGRGRLHISVQFLQPRFGDPFFLLRLRISGTKFQQRLGGIEAERSVQLEVGERKASAKIPERTLQQYRTLPVMEGAIDNSQTARARQRNPQLPSGITNPFSDLCQ